MQNRPRASPGPWLGVELSPDKTLITHARTRAARYLGYEITVQHADRKITRGRRAANGTIALRVPLDVIRAKRAPYRHHGKPGWACAAPLEDLAGPQAG